MDETPGGLDTHIVHFIRLMDDEIGTPTWRSIQATTG